MDNVSETFSNIKTTVQTIYTDECCKIENKLLEIFPSAEVKLDLFHAIARLTKHMSKKHPLYSEAVREITLIFRQADDIGVFSIYIATTTLLDYKMLFS